MGRTKENCPEPSSILFGVVREQKFQSNVYKGAFTGRNEKLEENKIGNACEKNWRECKKGG